MFYHMPYSPSIPPQALFLLLWTTALLCGVNSSTPLSPFTCTTPSSPPEGETSFSSDGPFSDFFQSSFFSPGRIRPAFPTPVA